MSILTVTSTNPKFSWIIQKNPATIKESGKPFHRSIRQGQLYGWFTDYAGGEQSFRLWFKDHPTKSSFADSSSLAEFEYLDRTRYASPYLPIMIIGEALATAAKSKQEDDSEDFLCAAETTIKISRPRLLQQFTEHYAEKADIVFEQVAEKYYKVTVVSYTVFRTLNILQTLCVLQAMADPESYVQLDMSGIAKYIRTLNNADAPYYVRYLFGSRAITNRSVFDRVKDDLQGEGMTLFYGDTRQQRFDAISQELTGGSTLVDIGCGEMFYAQRLSKKYQDIHCVDSDEELCSINVKKIESRKLDNVVCMHDTASPEFVENFDFIFDGADVLATEVLEHMPEEAAFQLLNALLRSNARKIVVTVPNASFNEYYGLSEDFRHPDHHFEPTFEGWCDEMCILAAAAGWEVENKPIGDVVNDRAVSTMTVFTKPGK